jgi:hypothetical protein
LTSNTFLAIQVARNVMQELEQTFGAYPHETLLVYCTGASSGGMEYAGAAMTSQAALGHEITHSWFARGVMPANGSAGWIDEAIARWRDLGYPRANVIAPRPLVHLAGFSPYRQEFLEQETGIPLTAMFDRHVYGKDEDEDGDFHESLPSPVELFESAGVEIGSAPPPTPLHAGGAARADVTASRCEAEPACSSVRGPGPARAR